MNKIEEMEARLALERKTAQIYSMPPRAMVTIAEAETLVRIAKGAKAYLSNSPLHAGACSIHTAGKEVVPCDCGLGDMDDELDYLERPPGVTTPQTTMPGTFEASAGGE